jgi:hypothetical protein
MGRELMGGVGEVGEVGGVGEVGEVGGVGEVGVGRWGMQNFKIENAKRGAVAWVRPELN